MRNLRGVMRVGALALGLCALRPAVASADITTGNLLVNPGAESGSISGWTVGGTSNPGVDNGSFDTGINPHTGSFDFYGHTGALGTLSQTVALVGNQGLTAAAIDAGLTTANVGFWEQGLSQGTPSDDGSVTLTFLDATSTALGSASTPEVDSHSGAWQSFAGGYAIPVGTRSIVYTMNFIRYNGSDNDSFLDDNSLTVTASVAAVPEPGGLALAGLGGLGLMGSALRRRGRARAGRA